jgi:tetratricopeptide (TPR) repeat protein
MTPPRDLPARLPASVRSGLRVAVLASVALLSACDGDAERRSVTHVADPGDVSSEAHGGGERISQQLMVALAQAKNFHHRAKVYMSDGNTAEAIDSVRRILSLRFPPGAPEAEDVRADARALLAKLMIGHGELEEAARVVDEGVANASRDSFFIANLYTVRGEIHEAQAAAEEARGEAGKAAAVSHRREAILAFERSIAINSAIQQRLFEGGRP